jgi:hypothetical protein
LQLRPALLSFIIVRFWHPSVKRNQVKTCANVDLFGYLFESKLLAAGRNNPSGLYWSSSSKEAAKP